MEIQKKPTLAEKQTFWGEQLPNFESKYWLPSHFDFLAFDMDQGNYVVKDDLDPIYEEDTNEIFHRVNTGWAMWKKAVNFTVKEAKASVEPEGFVLVPEKPTEELLSKAIRKYLEVSDLSIITNRMAHLYELMIKEAQEQKA